MPLIQPDSAGGTVLTEGGHYRRLAALGVIKDTGHEYLRGSLVVPVFDHLGRVVQSYGRKITPNLRAGTPLHLWLPGPMRGVWNTDGIARARTVILAQGLIDALTFWAAGHRNVTAVLGTALHDELPPFLRAQGTRAVLLAFRRDAEGQRVAERVSGVLLAAGIGCYRVEFPAGMDANDLARASDDPQRALARVLRHAVWLGKGAGPEVEIAPVLAPVSRVGIVTAGPATTRHAPTLASQQREPPSDTPAAEDGPTSPPDPLPEVATPEPPEPAAPDVPTEATEHEIVIHLGDRRYRVRGLARNLSHDTLRVNLLVTSDADRGASGFAFHADTLDLYSARQRGAFVKAAASELGLREATIKQDLGKVLLRLEGLQEEQIRKALEPKRKEVALDDTERAAALELLGDPNLVDRIVADFDRVGVVGEATNKLVAYLAAVSRKLDDPLAVLVQSSSAAGKTSLMDAVLAFVPEEDRLHYAAMTGQSLFYMGEQDLRHRVLAIAEEEGAERASYALKLLQSEGELTIASTGKDPNTGRLVAQEYRVQGPVMLFLTTTAIDLDDEFLNRCLVLTVNEDREQTRAIHRLQRERETLAGLLARKDRDAVLALHRNAQRLLRPLAVVNPYAPDLTFLDDRTRTRRDHRKYLTLIRAIALLHQHQRAVRTVTHDGQPIEYIEATIEDVALANRLAHEVLGRSLDEVPPHTRRLLALLHDLVAAECAARAIERTAYRFTRRALREAIGWGDTALKVHLGRLVDLEYLLVHGGRGHHEYELVYDGQGRQGERFLPGLLDADSLRRSGVDPARSGSGQAPVGPRSGAGQGDKTAGNATEIAALEQVASPPPNEAPQDPPALPSYPQITEGE